ncbi:MAG TPA: HNH endonuclease [Allocoleopsis sp.]
MSNTYIPLALRKLVIKRAKNRCEYCLIPDQVSFAPLEIDHIIAEKHDGKTDADNLALSCTLCNKYKGSDLTSIDPNTQEIVPLYNPRQDSWSDHFQLDNGEIKSLTAIGRVTVKLLQINRQERIKERLLLIESGLFEISSNN